jgi:2'-5' RNA ligase
VPAVLRRSRPELPRFAVAWFPRFEGLAEVEAFRRAHDPMARLLPAHLSLVFPFPTAHTRLQVETHVKRVVSRWPPIPASFRAVRMHANEFVFLMASRGADSLTALHERLYTRSLRPHRHPEFAYEPHITIARNPDPAKLEKSFMEGKAAFTGEFADLLREVELISVEPDGKIERLKTLALDSN